MARRKDIERLVEEKSALLKYYGIEPERTADGKEVVRMTFRDLETLRKRRQNAEAYDAFLDRYGNMR